MKKLLLYPSLFLMAVLCMCACHKPTAEVFEPAREFTPTKMSVTGGDTVVTISWPASVNAAPGLTYTLQISTDSSFSGKPDLSLVVNTTSVQVTDDSLMDRTPYYVRIKANGNNGSADSYWGLDTISFSFVGVQIFKTIGSSDVIDVAAILRWTPTPGVSEITLTDPGGNTAQYAVTDAAGAVGIDTIYNLKPGIKYSAEIFAGTKSKGLETFTTKTAATGANIIDLRGIADADVLVDTLPDIASGSTVLLERGMTYNVQGYTIGKTVTIMSGLGFGDPAVLSLGSNFNAAGNIDSIRFSDLVIAASGTNYFFNISNLTNINKMSVVNCTTQGQFANSFIRMQTANDRIGTLTIDNCIIDSVGVKANYAVIYANASSSAIIDNIRISNSTFYYLNYFIREDGVAPASLQVSNCTFDNFISQNGYFANYSGTPPPTFNISNCIFGNTLDPASSNGVKSSQNAAFSNSYMTSDCVFSANPFTGVTSYAGTAAGLFTGPATGDFTIKDGSFAGKSSAGDPRWRD